VAEDLKSIKEFIAEDNEEMAVKTIEEIYTRIEEIQQFPHMGADLSKRVSFRTDYKYSVSGNYAEYEKAVSKGAVSVLAPETEPWGQRTCYIADPEGNLIEIGSFNKPFRS